MLLLQFLKYFARQVKRNSFNNSKIVKTNKLTVYPQISCWSPSFSSNKLKASKSVFVSNSISFSSSNKIPNSRSFNSYVTRGPFLLSFSFQFQMDCGALTKPQSTALLFSSAIFTGAVLLRFSLIMTRLNFGRSGKLRKGLSTQKCLFSVLENPLSC